MAYRPVAQLTNELGFSLKPPRWVRKAQPGKVLKKAAIPLAIGASLLIPGATPVAIAAIKGASRLIGKGASTIMPIVRTPVAQQVASHVLPPISFVPQGAPADDSSSAMPQSPAQPSAPVGAGAAAEVPAGSGATTMPGWVLPAAIAGLAVLFMSSRHHD